MRHRRGHGHQLNTLINAKGNEIQLAQDRGTNKMLLFIIKPIRQRHLFRIGVPTQFLYLQLKLMK